MGSANRTLFRCSLLFIFALSSPVLGEVSLAGIFSDHMVLQRDIDLPIWGRAAPGEEITITLDEATRTVAADDEGRWRLDLPPQRAGGPTALVVEGQNTIRLEDVLIGEVWIASGQSNMGMTVASSDNAEAEIAAASAPQIRLYSVPHVISFAPEEEVGGQWRVCSPQTVGSFSAVAYYCGRSLHEELGVPVGLINTSWGGTIIEAWTDRTSLEKCPDLAAQLQRMDDARGHWEELREKKRASVAAMHQMETDAVLAATMSDPALDDATWPEMVVPEWWEKAGLPDFDGLVWFRKSLELPASWAGQDLVLHLGPVDEIDATYFNGERIGGQGSYAEGMVDHWDDPREYGVPGSLVKAGRNLLTVRIIDTARAGGLWGSPAEEMYLTPADAVDAARVSVAGAWRYQTGPQLFSFPEENSPNQPAVLYNAMVHPLIPFAFRGVLWYQGEGNVGQGLLYTDRMQSLIEGWRGLWSQGDFPFYYTQLAPFRYPSSSPHLLPQMWEAQERALRLPNTGMAATTDIGDLADIHPTNKQEVGRRLALWALARTYGRDVVYSGPRYEHMKVEGEALRLHFHHVHGGLASRDHQPLTWFEIAGADSTFVPATAVIDGETVVVSSPQVPEPMAARFGWHQEAEPNLVNDAGLPALPFRTHH